MVKTLFEIIMTKAGTNQSKVINPTGSKAANSKVPLNYQKITISAPDKNVKANNLTIQRGDTSEEKNFRMFLFHLLFIILTIFAFFYIFYIIRLAPYNFRQSVVETVRVEIKDMRAPLLNTKEKPKLVESQSKTNGTNVLVYDGKQKYVTWPDPPPKDDLPFVARYVMHISEFGSLATYSTHKGIEGYPFVNVFSVSDGPYNKSTGTPYFYFTPLELSVIDMKASNKVSLTVTEAQSDYCNKNGFDPEDPRCSHVIFTGTMTKIEKDTDEEKFARNSLFSRHVEMPTWPSGHDWFFAKMEIQHIYLLDFFGGAEVIDVKEYFASNPFDKTK